jgi:hypothetical protein
MKFIIIILAFLIFQSCKKERPLEKTDCSKINASYSSDIKKIIKFYCLNHGCHGSGDSNGDFSTYEGLKDKADNGRLRERVLNNRDMPRRDLGIITIDDLRKIKCWLDSGAPNN